MISLKFIIITQEPPLSFSPFTVLLIIKVKKNRARYGQNPLKH